VRVRETAVSHPVLHDLQARLGNVEHNLDDLKLEVRELARTMHERFDRQTATFDARLDQQATTLNARLDHHAATLGARLDQQAATLNARLDQQTATFDARFDQLNERLDEWTKWSVALLGLFGTVIAILVGIEQFVR
jgi:DNA anti-recombination protein RmuC